MRWPSTQRRVHAYIERERMRHPLHFTLIDPDKQTTLRASELAYAAQEAGSHAIMVGGSTGLNPRLVDDTVRAIKKRVHLPVILFPPGAEGISPHADAVFWMSMLNSRNRRFLIDEQRFGAPFVKKMGLEPLSMAYLVVEPGGTVGMVGEADLLARDDPQEAIGYALAAQYFGMDYIYLEAGSGASDPVPLDYVKAIRKQIDIPLIVGGGIRDRETARAIVEAGADIIVTGTLIENVVDARSTLAELLEYLRDIVRRGVGRFNDPQSEGSKQDADEERDEDQKETRKNDKQEKRLPPLRTHRPIDPELEPSRPTGDPRDRS